MIAVSSDRFNPQPKNACAMFGSRRSLRQKKVIAAATPPIIDFTQNMKMKIANAIQL